LIGIWGSVAVELYTGKPAERWIIYAECITKGSRNESGADRRVDERRKRRHVSLEPERKKSDGLGVRLVVGMVR